MTDEPTTVDEYLAVVTQSASDINRIELYRDEYYKEYQKQYDYLLQQRNEIDKRISEVSDAWTEFCHKTGEHRFEIIRQNERLQQHFIHRIAYADLRDHLPAEFKYAERDLQSIDIPGDRFIVFDNGWIRIVATIQKDYGLAQRRRTNVYKYTLTLYVCDGYKHIVHEFSTLWGNDKDDPFWGDPYQYVSKYFPSVEAAKEYHDRQYASGKLITDSRVNDTLTAIEHIVENVTTNSDIFDDLFDFRLLTSQTMKLPRELVTYHCIDVAPKAMTIRRSDTETSDEKTITVTFSDGALHFANADTHDSEVITYSIRKMFFLSRWGDIVCSLPVEKER